MKSNIIAAGIIAIGLIVAAFMHTGRYYILRVDADTVVRVDRWTGATNVVETDEWWRGLEDGRSEAEVDRALNAAANSN